MDQFTNAFNSNSVMYLIVSLEKLNSLIKNLGFVNLNYHLSHTINDLKNVGSDSCCISPKLLHEFLTIFEHECEKIKKTELDNKNFLSFKHSNNESRKNSNKNINPVNTQDKTTSLNNFLGSNLSLKNMNFKIENPIHNKDKEKSSLILNNFVDLNKNNKEKVISPSRLSPNVRDNSAQIEREILSKVKPVAFSGMLKLHFNQSKSLIQKIDKCKESFNSSSNIEKEQTNPFFQKNKRNDEIYPFKEEGFNCIIF